MEYRLNRIIANNTRVLLLLLLFGLLAYVNVLKGPFLFDDEHFIVKNVMIQSLKSIPDIYSSSVTEGAGISANFYRPNQQLMFAFLFQLFGLNALPYHLFSVLLHILNAFLLFKLINSIQFSRTASFVAAVLSCCILCRPKPLHIFPAWLIRSGTFSA